MDWKVFLQQLNHPAVRDMYWLLASPSPLRPHFNHEIPVFPSLWCEQMAFQAHNFFLNLDKQPALLQTKLNALKSTRLGIYAETLLGFFFEHFQHVRLLLTNYQVFDEGKTIGEIDFIIEWDGRVIHIELAVKYYLTKNSTDDFSNWIGPSGNDDLNKKLQKVKLHQLPLARSPLFRKQTKLYPDSYLFLKGNFFTFQDYYPNWKNDKSSYGNYYRITDFLNAFPDFSKLLLLTKPNWMADLVLPTGNVLPSANEDVRALFKHHGNLLLYDTVQRKPFFVVKDDWPG